MESEFLTIHYPGDFLLYIKATKIGKFGGFRFEFSLGRSYGETPKQALRAVAKDVLERLT